MPRFRPILILGPTAGGKSELAVRLAEGLAEIDGQAGEILGADSMQIYRHMDAGTAKPSRDQRRRARHHLIDIVEPAERFTVADWLLRARTLIAKCQQRGVRPIVVGGTNLYIKALLEGLAPMPPIDPAFRDEMARQDTASLHRRLKQVDHAAAERIHPNDRKRLTRALEVYHMTGRPISDQQSQWRDDQPPDTDEPAATSRDRQGALPRSRDASRNHSTAEPQLDTPLDPPPLLLGLHWPVEAINRRINLRVRAMFYPAKVDAGLAREICPNGESLPEEVARLEREGRLGPPDAQARQALGYKQVLAALAGEFTLEEAFEQTKVQTRRFAKQQRTWLKRFRDVHWLQPTEATSTESLAEEALKVVRQHCSPEQG